MESVLGMVFVNVITGILALIVRQVTWFIYSFFAHASYDAVKGVNFYFVEPAQNLLGGSSPQMSYFVL